MEIYWWKLLTPLHKVSIITETICKKCHNSTTTIGKVFLYEISWKFGKSFSRFYQIINGMIEMTSKKSIFFILRKGLKILNEKWVTM